MKLLKYESFLETMQFSVLTNAQRLAKQESDRKDKPEEEDKETPKTIYTNDYYDQEGAEENDYYDQEGAEEMEVQTEGGEMEVQTEGGEEMDPNYGQEGAETDF